VAPTRPAQEVEAAAPTCPAQEVEVEAAAPTHPSPAARRRRGGGGGGGAPALTGCPSDPSTDQWRRRRWWRRRWIVQLVFGR
jgi:hypothetical protein